MKYSPWEFRFVCGRRLVTVTVRPSHVLAVLLVAMMFYTFGSLHGASTQRRQAAELTAIHERNAALEKSLLAKELEREQMVALAEARSEELWRELGKRDRELNRLWHLVGSAPHHSGRESLLGSRGGGTRRALSVKVGFGKLEKRIFDRGQELKELSAAAAQYHRTVIVAKQRRLAEITPSIVPCKGEIASDFGSRVHPIFGMEKGHDGCDFATDYGTEIHATAGGKVVRSEWFGGYGQAVEIEHGNGLSTLYAHCGTLNVKKGQSVKKGQIIATVGTTGYSTGPHCHYEVHKNGKPVDPKAYFPKV